MTCNHRVRNQSGFTPAILNKMFGGRATYRPIWEIKSMKFIEYFNSKYGKWYLWPVRCMIRKIARDAWLNALQSQLAKRCGR